jgi:hypothetical protein
LKALAIMGRLHRRSDLTHVGDVQRQHQGVILIAGEQIMQPTGIADRHHHARAIVEHKLAEFPTETRGAIYDEP